ncbi:MAG: DUF4249 domain-containing protein, partial [Chitinophagaceae bacterium]
MKLLTRTIFLCISVFLLGCEKTIDVPLKTIPPKLVIDASINWAKNTTGNRQVIKISTTTGYYDTDFPAVSNAAVAVKNSSNTVFTFIESTTKGEYVCANFLPVIGETYTLSVSLNGAVYTAVETLMATPTIDDAINQSNTGGMTGDEMEIQFSFQDDITKDDFYLMGINTKNVAFTEYSLESDEMFQGKKMSQYYAHKDLKKGDLVDIRLYGVSKTFFDYFGKILVASGADTGPFPTTPAKVRGNIVNQ